MSDVSSTESAALTSEEFLTCIKDALDLKQQIDDGVLTVLDTQRVHEALDFLQSKTPTIKSRDRQLWGLAVLAAGMMLTAVVLSILRPF
jgi:hypothetical protein